MAGKESKIIIAHIGTTSAGKSTQFRENQNRFANDHSVLARDDDARRYFETFPSVLEKRVHTFGIQEPIQNYKIAHLRKGLKYEKADTIITDGSVIDPVVLLDFYGDKNGADYLLKRAEPFLPLYTLFVVHDPEGVPYEHEKERQETDAERLEIHPAYLNLLIMHDLPFVVISGTREERTRQINEAIDELRRQENVIFEAKSAQVA